MWKRGAAAFHFHATLFWALVLVLALVSWVVAALHQIDPQSYLLLSVGFISVCSIYANMMGHWSSMESAKAKEAVDGSNTTP